MIEEREFDGGKYRLYDMGIDQDSEDEELHLIMVDNHIPAGAKLY